MTKNSPFNASDEFKINEDEYGVILDTIGVGEINAKINIPKLMPSIEIADPTKTKDTMNPNVFINDPKFRINADSVIETQNYITIDMDCGVDQFNTTTKDGSADKQRKVNCRINNGNIRYIFVNNIMRKDEE